MSKPVLEDLLSISLADQRKYYQNSVAFKRPHGLSVDLFLNDFVESFLSDVDATLYNKHKFLYARSKLWRVDQFSPYEIVISFDSTIDIDPIIDTFGYPFGYVLKGKMYYFKCERFYFLLEGEYVKINFKGIPFEYHTNESLFREFIRLVEPSDDNIIQCSLSMIGRGILINTGTVLFKKIPDMIRALKRGEGKLFPNLPNGLARTAPFYSIQNYARRSLSNESGLVAPWPCAQPVSTVNVRESAAGLPAPTESTSTTTPSLSANAPTFLPRNVASLTQSPPISTSCSDDWLNNAIASPPSEDPIILWDYIPPQSTKSNKIDASSNANLDVQLPPVYEIGQQVVIKNLTSSSFLNGQQATVLSSLDSEGRYGVEVRYWSNEKLITKKVAVKPANLCFIPRAKMKTNAIGSAFTSSGSASSVSDSKRW